MRFSVLSTLKEALNLWVRHLAILIPAAFVIALPTHIFGLLDYIFDADPLHPAGLIILGNIAAPILRIISEGVGIAAVLNILFRGANENRSNAIQQGINDYALSLMGVDIWLGLIAMVLFVPVFALIFVFRGSPLWGLLVVALAVIFLKYALAKPLVVAENMKAWPALAASWQMTRSRFGYVLGCYLIFGVIEGLLQYGINFLHASIAILWPITFSVDVIDTYPIIIAWVMYLRFRAGEETLPVVEVEPVLS